MRQRASTDDGAPHREPEFPARKSSGQCILDVLRNLQPALPAGTRERTRMGSASAPWRESWHAPAVSTATSRCRSTPDLFHAFLKNGAEKRKTPGSRGRVYTKPGSGPAGSSGRCQFLTEQTPCPLDH